MKKKNKKSSNLLNIFICLSCSVLVCGFIFFKVDRNAFMQYLHNLNGWWILAALGCMVGYWLFEAGILHVIIKADHKDHKFSQTFHVTMGGQYFNNVTPFASGGQPFQAYYLNKQGMPLGEAMNCLLTKFIVFQFSLVIFSAALLILRLGYFQQKVSNFSFIVLVGFAVNFGVMLFLFSLAFFKTPTKKLSHFAIKALHKIHIVKDYDAKIEYMDNELDKFNACFKKMSGHVPTLIMALILSFFQQLIHMSVTYMIYRAFGLHEVDFITILAAQSFVSMVSAFIPIPGASGGAESFFAFFFKQFFPDGAQRGVALIIWRVITFYFTLIVGAFFTIGMGGAKGKLEEIEKNER